MKLDELIIQFDTLKGKNDKVIKFQEENFSKHDSGIEDVVSQHRFVCSSWIKKIQLMVNIPFDHNNTYFATSDSAINHWLLPYTMHDPIQINISNCDLS